RKLSPGLSAVRRAEQCRVLNPGIDDVGLIERWLQMPYALELPLSRCAVVPLVGCDRRSGLSRGVVYEFIALAFRKSLGGGSRFPWGSSRLEPGLAAVV